MDKFVIKGGTPLRGEVQVSGAKNAAVAIIPATILAGGPCLLENIPDISDVYTLYDNYGHLIQRTDTNTTLKPTASNNYSDEEELAKLTKLKTSLIDYNLSKSFGFLVYKSVNEVNENAVLMGGARDEGVSDKANVCYIPSTFVVSKIYPIY